jgi:hypothetical protein
VREQFLVTVSVALVGVAACSLDLHGSRTLPLDASGSFRTKDAGAAQGDGDAGDIVAHQGDGDSMAADNDAGGDGDATQDAGTPDAGRPPLLCGDDPALVACFPFDADTFDHGPRGNHLVSTDVSFEPGGGVLLNAGSGLVRADRAELHHSETTLLLWVRVDAMPTSGRAGIVDHDGQYGMFVHPGGELHCALGIAGASALIVPGALKEKQWQHVGCVAEGTMVHLYVDGKLVASGPASSTRTPGASPLQVGENAPDGADQLIGAIDNLRIWDAQWTAEQVADDAKQPR